MAEDASRRPGDVPRRPNILVLCVDQWQTHMQLPDEVPLPAVRRLEERGVSFDRQYCTAPMCTPSRATMWTGVHAVRTDAWDNTNFAWIQGLSQDVPTIGHLLRQEGYYTAFKGKWHLSDLPRGEDALERYGFADYQQWGDMFGAPLQGEMLDGSAAAEAVDWLEHRATALDQPWLLVCSLLNPHDVMYLQTDPVQAPGPQSQMQGQHTTVQRLGWFEQQWDIALPDNFADDYAQQPPAVQHYKDYIDAEYGRIPDDRADLWLRHRNYLVNCMRLADAQFTHVLDAVDRLDMWQDTVVILTGDHGEMNGAHRMTQKGAIHFDEAAVVHLTICAPDAPRGRRTAAVGSHLDLAPTLLTLAGLSEDDIAGRYPHLKGRSLAGVVREPHQDGPRGSSDSPGDGALVCWDGLSFLDAKWSSSGALQELSDMSTEPPDKPGDDAERMREIGSKYGAPVFGKRNYFRAVVDGRFKLVRWFSPLEYGTTPTLQELYARSDVTLHDLVADPGELENLAHPEHPRYDPAALERLLDKLNALIEHEIGADRCPFDMDMFGVRAKPSAPD